MKDRLGPIERYILRLLARREVGKIPRLLDWFLKVGRTSHRVIKSLAEKGYIEILDQEHEAIIYSYQEHEAIIYSLTDKARVFLERDVKDPPEKAESEE